MASLQLIDTDNYSAFRGTDVRVLTQIEHVRQSPGMYVGNVKQTPRSEFLLVGDKLMESTVTVPEGLVRIFIELIANAVDNVNRSWGDGIDPGVIKVYADRASITVYNEGSPMEIKLMKDSNLLVPTVVFGTMLSSTNFVDNTDNIGQNGIGAKATNILSLDFHVEVYDAYNHRHYKQRWRPVMQADPPLVEDYNGAISTVTVSYSPDFEFFGYYDRQFPDEFFYIVARICAESCFTTRVPVYFNDVNYADISPTIIDYGRLYLGQEANVITYYQWAEGVEVVRDKRGIERSKYGHANPIVELAIFDAGDNGRSLSFANGMMTFMGGVHAEAAIKSISDILVTYVNDKGNGKRRKRKEDQAPLPKITLRDVRKYVNFAISVRVNKPIYDSQSKTLLRSPDISITFDRSFINSLKSWNLTQRLLDELNSKQMRVLKKTDGSKRAFIGDIKGNDANDAGTARNSHNCTLIIVEGDSAKNYVLVMLGLHPYGRDRIGILPIRGKLRNALNATPLQLAENKEFCQIKKMLGLEEGIDYTVESNRKKLRYGNLMILTDADVDGIHIKGLILALFKEYYPSLLKIGFIADYRTPYLRMRKGNQVECFLFEREFREWKSRTPDWKTWTSKYYKGLGSSEKSDVVQDYNNPHVVGFTFDEWASQAIDLAFHPDHIEGRKSWLARFNVDTPVPEVGPTISITEFVNTELITYTVANVIRHIPNIIDGLKPCQRKVIFGMLLRWGRNHSKAKQLKIGNFASFVNEKSNYHHGDSLPNVIIGMAQDFVGSNTLPYFTQKSMLGTRDLGGKDAAQPRYTFTTPEWWIKYWLNVEDDQLLTQIIDEGEAVEPHFYLTLFPIWAVNGASGIGTAHSTFIPCHHPLDITGWLKDRLSGKQPREVKPWYRGFTGDVEIIDRRKQHIDEPDSIIELPGTYVEENYQPQDVIKSTGRYSFVTYGNYTVSRDGTIEITELPIGTWTDKYRRKLIKWQEEKRISDLRDKSDDVKIYFSFRNFIGENKTNMIVTHKDLALRTSFGMTNMVLLVNGKPIKYNNLDSMLEDFFLIRLPFYEQRRLTNIEKLSARQRNLHGKAKFIVAVIEEKLQVTRTGQAGRPVAEIHRDMDNLGIEREYLKKVRFHQVTREEVAKLNLEIEKISAEIAVLTKTKPEDIWYQDLVEFEEAYEKHYPNDRVQYVKQEAYNPDVINLSGLQII